MNKLYLQNIVENFDLNNLPADWLGIDFEKFSLSKSLFDYQQNALRNALKALYLFYEEDKGDKKSFYKRFINNGLTENLNISLKEERKTTKYLLDYDKDFPVNNEEISFEYFINRMSFWMATGSGKTLVIVKLIELISYLMKDDKLPKKDILFLTYRDDLIEQFKKHVDEFNHGNNTFYINLIDLKDYSSRKRMNELNFRDSIDVYYYRSDLISDEQKDKIVNYRNYDNNGNWYILLDEAHKGDKDESKRQVFYTILSRNGFLFNFSATFTDERDFVTCVFNFNLARFIENGYGKHIYISKENISMLDDNDISEREKQKIILKIFVLQTVINKIYDELKVISQDLYHRPLLLTLVNSVNTDDSDLEMFFREIEKIALGNNLDQNLLDSAKNELIQELTNENAKFVFEEEKISQNIVGNIEQISYSDILKYVFNSKTNGRIEILRIPGNKQELVFKLKTSSQPFALMKIGDISEWIKNKLSGYEIVEKFDDESIFKNINNSEDINILMGSRSFYEGWDSNRPNIILFINIGKGIDARKFVLQSIGRGVRIEPLPNKRKRVVFLYNNNQIDENLFSSIKYKVEPLETLFVFGTKADNLNEVIKTLKQEKPDVLLGDLFEINPDVKDKLLLIPVYKESGKILVEEQHVIKFPISINDFDSVKKYFKYLDDKICLVKYDPDIKVLKKLKEAFNGGENDYFLLVDNEKEINNPDFLLRKIFKHFISKSHEFIEFKRLEDEIIHFKRISISVDKLNSLREKIEKVKKSKDKELLEKDLDKKFDEGKISKDEYKLKIKELEKNMVKEEEVPYSQNERLKIKYLANHYYLPIALTELERVNFIQHIIKHKSEVDFINDLENYLKEKDSFFMQFDWWYFSKIDETLDEIYIPYYQPKTNRIEKFKPDFIFWLKKDNIYLILFVDPKGTEYSDGYRKIDGYSRIFETEENGKRQARVFSYNGLTVYTKLLLRSKQGIANVLENYKHYWFDSFGDFAKKIQL